MLILHHFLLNVLRACVVEKAMVSVLFETRRGIILLFAGLKVSNLNTFTLDLSWHVREFQKKCCLLHPVMPLQVFFSCLFLYCFVGNTLLYFFYYFLFLEMPFYYQSCLVFFFLFISVPSRFSTTSCFSCLAILFRWVWVWTTWALSLIFLLRIESG